MLRRFFVPEVIQTSAMDCGPASLKALLEGHGIHASYGRLREACQTEVDGTSIDTLEQTAQSMGLEATQVMVPLDHLLERKAKNLPALVVVRQPNGSHHFVVVWRKHAGWLQVMDPAMGRRWVRQDRFLEDVYEHTLPVDAAMWNGWAQSEGFLGILHLRLKRLGAKPTDLTQDLEGPAIARLDAAARMTERLAAAGAVRRGAEAARMVAQLARGTAEIPAEYWTAAPIASTQQVTLRGAVLLQISGKREATATTRISSELDAALGLALSEKPSSAWRELLHTVAQDGWGPLAMLILALWMAAAASIVEALLLRGFYDVGRELTSAGQRGAALGAAIGITAVLALTEFALAFGVLRMGRRLDIRLRLRFFHKIPRLADRYFRSRPTSDMAERSHNVQLLRQAPELASSFLRNTFEIVLTVAAIGWLYPQSLLPALLTAIAALGIPLLAQPALAERDLKLRVHAGALLRFNLDALLGATAIRAHGAARAVRSEHNSLLGEWARSGYALVSAVTWVDGLQTGVCLGLAAWVFWTALAASAGVAGALLLVYWVLNIPALGQDAASAIWQYPLLRNTTLRFIEPLGAPQEPEAAAHTHPARGAAEIRLEEVTVTAAGHKILDEVNLWIAPGEHVAIVGRSGAGKSSLAGLLLGWHRPSAGRLLVDRDALDAAGLDRLRASTAWVDPQIQIWNESLYENLTYGNPSSAPLEQAIEDSGLRAVMDRMPDGMRSPLGEGGGLVSGGEGQRVRLGRAFARAHVRLAILDEPARGLDRHQRARAIDRARERWSAATLLCITHDVSDTLTFPRVLVIDDGRIVEDGRPAALAANPESRYRRMLDEERHVRRGLWEHPMWRRLSLAGGRISEGVREKSLR